MIFNSIYFYVLFVIDLLLDCAMHSFSLLSLLNTLICIFVFAAAPFACNIESTPLAPRRVTSGNGKATATKTKIKKKSKKLKAKKQNDCGQGSAKLLLSAGREMEPHSAALQFHVE